MPKKGRNGQRQQNSKPEQSYATPTSDLLDIGADTPDVAPSSLPEHSPLFTFDSDVERVGVGDMEYGAVEALEGAYGISREGSDEANDRPSPLALSPLSRPARTSDPTDYTEERSVGHTRSPVLVVEPNMLDSLSRTVRAYVPTSIPIPNAIPTPPRVSRPVSFGSFFTGPPAPSSSASPASRQLAYTPPEAMARASSRNSSNHAQVYSPVLEYSPPTYDTAGRQRRTSTYGADVAGKESWQRGRKHAGVPPTTLDVPALELDGGEPTSRRDSIVGSDVTRYPGGKVQEDEVIYAGWSTLDGNGYELSRRLLILGYTSGLQVWDCTDLNNVEEMLNLTVEWGRVTFAAVLPDPSSSGTDRFAAERPLIGIIQEQDDLNFMSVYSLTSHRVVKRIDINHVVSFAANDLFIILSTSVPASLHIIAANTFATLFTVSSSSLVPFMPSVLDKPHPVLSTHLEHSQVTPPSVQRPPQPVYALSHRLLAFASPPPSPDSPTAGTSAHPRARRLSVAGTGIGSSGAGNSGAFNLAGVSVSQADIGNAALKVGGSVLSGMKTLGGFAFSAARARMAGTPAAPEPTGAVLDSREASGGISKMFFSKSAPAASEGYGSAPGTPGRNASFGQRSVLGDPMMASTAFSAAPVPTAHASPASDHFITVLDLASLLASRKGARPDTVAEFAAARAQQTAGLAFTADGTELIVSPKDGQTVKVFKLRPTPKALVPYLASSVASTHTTKHATSSARHGSKAARATEHIDLTMETEAPWHVYDLRRGRTSAVIERAEGDADGRWVAIATRNRTVHVFAVNPYGGRPDERSHLEGKVRNSPELPLSVDVSAIVRLRAARPASGEQRPPCALVFAFLKTGTSSLPSSLLPPATPYLTPKSPPLSLPPSPAQRPLSSPSQSPRAQRPTNYQDLLIFDPLSGALSLRRFVIERRTHEANTFAVNAAVPVIGGTSISLPSMSPLSRMSSSPPAQMQRAPSSGLTQMMERPVELVGRESQVATWNLKRGTGWREIKQVVKREEELQRATTGRLNRLEWLSQAELSTSSRSPRLLPRSVYLSHQFSFHALGEDYHALIRRFHFDVPATKLDVRREVAATASVGAYGETFLQSGSAPRDIRGTGGGGASFDEPLASALSGGLEYPSTSPAVLPMFPNGTPGSHRAYLPIRNVAAGLSDGVSEGFGRLRRGVGRARAARAGAEGGAGLLGGPGSLGAHGVPLEFDEEDEDFAPAGSARRDDDGLSLGTGTSAGEGSMGGVVLPPTPPTGHAALPRVEGSGDGDDAWAGWDAQDAQAVDDAERFDDLVVGFMDEEQQHQAAVPVPERKAKARETVRKKKGKK